MLFECMTDDFTQFKCFEHDIPNLQKTFPLLIKIDHMLDMEK